MDETVKNKLKDVRIARTKNNVKDARITKIKNESKVENYDGSILWIDFSKNARNCWKCGKRTIVQLWSQKGSLNPWTQSRMEIAARVKD